MGLLLPFSAYLAKNQAVSRELQGAADMSAQELIPSAPVPSRLGASAACMARRCAPPRRSAPRGTDEEAVDTRSPKKEEAQQEPPTKPTITDVFSEGDTGDVRILAKHVDQGFFLAEVTMFKNNQQERVRVWWPFDEPNEPGTGSNANAETS